MKWLCPARCCCWCFSFYGLVSVFSASAVMAKETLGSPYSRIWDRQAMWALVGMLALVALMQVDYRVYNNPRVVYPAVAVTLLLLIGVFAMRDSHNTHRWFRFGGLFTTFPAVLRQVGEAGAGTVPGVLFARRPNPRDG